MTNYYKRLGVIMMFLFLSSSLFAQSYKITGSVTDAMTGEKLIGANVYIKGTNLGSATDETGKYAITASKGLYALVCSYIGYETKVEDINLTNDMVADFQLKDYQFSLSLTVLAERAKERETPVAFTNLDKAQITSQLGSRDIPLVLNNTPSVYSTVGGGGAGDARINVRGFDQKNVAIMINGVPVNDMENGWVYWSNWDGVGDATSSIQMQRGLSAVNLATPSIGGTMNIMTDPAKSNTGFYYKNEIGSGNFEKQSLFVNSGLIDGKYAISVGGVKKTGKGVIDGTWTDASAYYFGASYQLNEKNRIELYATGAPQRHGQNLYKNNIASYSHEYAKEEFNYPDAALDAIAEGGRLWNPTVNGVSSTYDNMQYWDGEKQLRYDRSYINERENYYHKPIVNLNWYTQLSNKLSLYSTVYYSGGVGGGSGTAGSLKWDYTYLQRTADWDATIAANHANGDTSKGILRNSTNIQWTIGAISKAYYKVNKNLTVSAGLDWRTAKIDHYQEVRDLLGGKVYIDNNNAFQTTNAKKLGDRISYDYTNSVDWLGAFGQGEYTLDKLTAYGMFGFSMIKYNHLNHFIADANDATKKLELETDWISGFQVKGGASFRINREMNVYANAGYVSKVPIFDQVIDDNNAVVASDPANEKFISVEAGVNASLFNDKVSFLVNGYFTQWTDRAQSVYIANVNAPDALVFLNGIDAIHTGVEVEVGYRPVSFARIDAMASIGSWQYTDDSEGSYTSNNILTKYFYAIKDLKVGDAPQTQLGAIFTLYPITGFAASVQWKYNAKHYSAWDPFSRQVSDLANADREQVWETPAYHLFDLHFNYDLPTKIAGVNMAVFAHVFNLFDTMYIQDATDNSSFNGYKVAGKYFDPHGPSAAEVYLGMPRTFNLGFSINY